MEVAGSSARRRPAKGGRRSAEGQRAGGAANVPAGAARRPRNAGLANAASPVQGHRAGSSATRRPLGPRAELTRARGIAPRSVDAGGGARRGRAAAGSAMRRRRTGPMPNGYAAVGCRATAAEARRRRVTRRPTACPPPLRGAQTASLGPRARHTPGNAAPAARGGRGDPGEAHHPRTRPRQHNGARPSPGDTHTRGRHPRGTRRGPGGRTPADAARAAHGAAPADARPEDAAPGARAGARAPPGSVSFPVVLRARRGPRAFRGRG